MESRGRGKILEMLKKQQGSAGGSGDSSQDSDTSASTSGRGRAFEAFTRKVESRPGSIVAPASDVAPGQPTSSAGRGVGRGKFLQNLIQAKAESSSSRAPTHTDDVSTISSSMTEMSVGKNKPYKEIKDTPPVIKRGTSGPEIDVTANYIHLTILPGMGAFEYEVRFTPNIDAKNTRFKILASQEQLIGRTKSFDGTTLYLPRKLAEDVNVVRTINPHNDTPVEMKIIFRRERRMSEMLHIYNVIFKNIMRELEMVSFKRQYFNKQRAIAIPQHKLQVWPGYVTAVTEYEGGLMLSLDVMHKVLHTQTVHEFMRELVARDRANFKENFAQALFGNSVMTVYNNKTYRVDDLDESMTPNSSFETASGEKITIKDYYKQQYNININDLNQPLLVSRQMRYVTGSKEKVEFQLRLVPELCVLTGLSDTQRNDFRLMKDLAVHTRVTPNQRLNAYHSFMDSVSKNEKARNLLAQWGLQLANNPVQLKARTIQAQMMIFGKNSSLVPQNVADWNREVCRQPMLTTVDLTRWIMIYTKKDAQLAQEYVDCLLRCAPNMGWRVEKPRMNMLQMDRNPAWVEALQDVNPRECQLVNFLCPSSRDDRYAIIKKICCCDKGIPSQVINSRTIMNRDKQRSVVQKVALQLNTKLGGTLWAVKIPLPNAMIIGIDSYHQTAKKYKSVCGFVASYDASFTRWYSRTVFSETGQEIVDGLKHCLAEALKFYFNANGVFPNQIIMYRDGVGDGQLNAVADYEQLQLEEAISMVTGRKAKLTVIVVQKRINTRIFASLGKNRLENPPPGTVLDHTVTRRDWYDFFLVSQKVNQGTVTPTHYVVVSDNSDMTPDQIQKLSYKMTHLYYNWPGTVRVPAPCQYAHKLAYLVGQSTHQDAHPALSDRLFFL